MLGLISEEQLQQAHKINPLTGLEGLQLVTEIKRQVARRCHPDKITGTADDMYKMFNSRVDQLSKTGTGSPAEIWSAYCAVLEEEARAAELYIQHKAGVITVAGNC